MAAKDVEKLLSRCSPAVRATALKARAAVLKAIPGTGKAARLKLEKPADAARVPPFALQAAKRAKAA